MRGFSPACLGLEISNCDRFEYNRGFIVYTRSRNKLIEVPITELMYSELDGIIRDLLDVVQKGMYPKPTKYRARCGDSCYRNICEKVIRQEIFKEDRTLI